MTRELGRTDELDLEESAPPSSGPNLLTVAWRRKWLIVLGALIGVGLGYLYYLRQPPVYRSSAKVLVVKKNPSALPMAGMDGQPLENYISTHLVLLRSPVIIEGAVTKHDLQSLPSFAGRKPAGAIINGLSVSQESASTNNILNLSFRGPVSEDCKKVLDAVLESYVDFLGQTYQDVSDQTLKLIEDARDVLERDLKKQWNDYLAFRQEAPLLWKGSEGANIHQNRLGNIEGARSQLLLRRAETEGRIMAIEASLANGGDRAVIIRALGQTPTIHSTTGELAPLVTAELSPELKLEEQLFPLTLQKRMLLEDYGPDHPRVVAIEKQLQITREFYLHQSEEFAKLKDGAAKLNEGAAKQDRKEPQVPRDELDLYVQSLKQELEHSRLLEQSLTEYFNRERNEAKSLADVELKDEAWRDQYDYTKQLYVSVIKRLQEINVVKDHGGFMTRIISPAGRGSQIEPSFTRILTIAAFLGLLGGFGLAYLADITDKSFRSPEEIRRRLGLPVVGHIPLMHFVTNGQEVDSSGLDSLLRVYHRPNSRDAEAFRGIRTGLYFSTRGEGHKVVQITSPNPGDGKSTLAANLAVSMAQSGKRVLLLDADFRRPRQHKIFALESKTGLSSVFTGESELAVTVQQTAVPGLWLLPCGPRPHNPAELLTSSRFQDMIGTLREQYDFVIIDTPPLLVVTDPAAVAARVDGVILTIRVTKNGRADAERGREILYTLGAKVIGIVVNGVGGSDGYGYGKYGYRYGGYGYKYYRGYRYGSSYQYGSGYGSSYGGDPYGAGYGDGAYDSPVADNGDQSLKKSHDEPRATGATEPTAQLRSPQDGGESGKGFLSWFRKP